MHSFEKREIGKVERCAQFYATETVAGERSSSSEFTENRQGTTVIPTETSRTPEPTTPTVTPARFDRAENAAQSFVKVEGEITQTPFLTHRPGDGISKLHLATERSDGGLYARLGHEVVARTRKGDTDVVVMARHLDEPIQVVPYDDNWPARFRDEEASLHQLLKPWLVGPIEHVGSTAVPGLAAKPVIDIMAGIQSLDTSRDAIAMLSEYGYVYFPHRPHLVHWFCKPTPWRRTHHLHLVPFESPLWVQRLAFRNRLRQDPQVAAEYTELKRRLAQEHEFDREAYTDGKESFVRRVVQQTLGPGTVWVS